MIYLAKVCPIGIASLCPPLAAEVGKRFAGKRIKVTPSAGADLRDSLIGMPVRTEHSIPFAQDNSEIIGTILKTCLRPTSLYCTFEYAGILAGYSASFEAEPCRVDDIHADVWEIVNAKGIGIAVMPRHLTAFKHLTWVKPFSGVLRD